MYGVSSLLHFFDSNCLYFVVCLTYVVIIWHACACVNSTECVYCAQITKREFSVGYRAFWAACMLINEKSTMIQVFLNCISARTICRTQKTLTRPGPCSTAYHGKTKKCTNLPYSLAVIYYYSLYNCIYYYLRLKYNCTILKAWRLRV